MALFHVPSVMIFSTRGLVLFAELMGAHSAIVLSLSLAVMFMKRRWEVWMR